MAVTQEVAERRERALSLSVSGVTAREIGRQLGVSHTQIARDISAEIAALEEDGVINRPTQRALMTRQYERLLAVAMPRALGIHAEGARPDLQWLDRTLKILEGMRKLKGLDRDPAPTVHEIGVNG